VLTSLLFLNHYFNMHSFELMLAASFSLWGGLGVTNLSNLTIQFVPSHNVIG
jgi:hypothetical protein